MVTSMGNMKTGQIACYKTGQIISSLHEATAGLDCSRRARQNESTNRKFPSGAQDGRQGKMVKIHRCPATVTGDEIRE
jgi:hypothetical protein